MDIDSKPAERRWTRFSLRGLLVVITLCCVYFACWGPTKSIGNADVGAYLTERNKGNPVVADPVAPLLFRWGVAEIHQKPRRRLVTNYTYYFWCFGYVAKLPLTTTARDVPVASNQPFF